MRDAFARARVAPAAALALIACALLLVPGDAGKAARAERGGVSRGWLVTVYYTAVESHHDGAPVAVTGCPVLECARGRADLGRYPEDFVAAVRAEGTGRIVRGPRAGSYLNWSHDVGYWLDSAPRNSYGQRLRPFVSAAADAGVLARGQRVRIVDCGAAEDGSPIEPEVCAALRAASWRIDDEFSPGLGGERHLDVYLGEETGPGFTEDPLYTALYGATLRLPPG